MKKILFTIVAGIASTTMFAQTGPGGVSGGLKIWLRADSLITLNPASTGGTSVASWGNIANPSQVFDTTTSGTVAPQANNTPSSPIPTYITFNGTSVLADSLADISDLDGTQYDCFIVHRQSGGNGVILYVGPRTPVGNDNIGWGNANSAIFATTASSSVYITANVSNADIKVGNPAIYNWNCDAPTGTESVANSTLYSLNGGGNIAGGTGGTAFEGVKPTIGYPGTVLRPIATAGQALIAIGARKGTSGEYTGGGGDQVYEVILYSRKLSLAERQKVLSYLAMKYNVTLAITSNPVSIADTGYTSQNGTYFASDGTPVFERDNYRTTAGTIQDSFYMDGSAAVVYAMGRDDASGLHTVGNNGYGTYIETGTKQNFTNDKAFFFMTSNNASNSANTDLVANPVPSGANILARSPKVWKMTATNVNDEFKFVPSLGSGYGTASTANDSLLLLVSSTPAFATGDTKGFKTSGRVFGGSGFAYWDHLDPADVFGSTTTPVTKYFTVALLDGTTSALPVGLTNFTAVLQNGSVILQWNSNVENGASYTVQRSVNGTWKDIATIAAKGDNQSYSYTDASPVNGATNMYRIKETEQTGKVFYSEIRYADLKNGKVLAELKAYPNPTSGIVYLSSETSAIDANSIAVYNVAGQHISAATTANGTKATVDLSAQASGIYFIRANGHVVKVLKK